MGKSFGVCRVSGIDVKVHWSCLLLLSFFAMVGHQVAESVAGAVVAVGMIGELFLCVLRASSQKQLTGAGDARRCASHPTMSAVGGRDA